MSTIAEIATVRVWQIGTDGTEYYAARSEEEMKAFYFVMDEDGKEVKTTWRKLAESSTLPCQISSGYN